MIATLIIIGAIVYLIFGRIVIYWLDDFDLVDVDSQNFEYYSFGLSIIFPLVFIYSLITVITHIIFDN
jgi:hypothetical protein